MICVVVQTVIFGLGNVVTKFAYESVTPLWCMVLRFGLAFAAFALVFCLRMVHELRGGKLADWTPAAACLAVGYIACNLALDVTTTTTNTGFLVALPVVFTPLIAQVVRRVRYPPRDDSLSGGGCRRVVSSVLQRRLVLVRRGRHLGGGRRCDACRGM